MFLDRLFGCQLRYVEYVLASFAISWGAWLLAPWDAFASTPTFATAHRIAPEWAWGIAITTGGLLLLTGLLMQSRPVRKAGLMLLSMLWLAVWLSLTIGNWQSTASTVYIHVFVMCVFAYLRVARGVQQ